MTFELKTISGKTKYIIFGLIGTVISVAGGLGLAIFFHNEIIAATLPILLFATSIYIVHKISMTTSNILIDENYIQINDEKIMFENISGYFVESAPITVTINLKLKSKAIARIIGIDYGKQGKIFREFISQLTNSIKAKTVTVEELSFQDIYPWEATPVKPFFFFVIAFNVFAIYLLLTQDYFTWKIFLFNIAAFGMKPYLKKKK